MNKHRVVLFGTIVVFAALAAFVRMSPASVTPKTADVSISDRPGTPGAVYLPGQTAKVRIRVFNENPRVGFSAAAVTATVNPVKTPAGFLTSFTNTSGNCTQGGFNAVSICSFNALNAQSAKFGDFDVVLGQNICGSVRNGQIKVATAVVASNTTDPNPANNTTNVYVKVACN